MIMTWRNLFSTVPVGWFPRTEKEDDGWARPPSSGGCFGGKKQESSFYRSLNLREEINEKEK